MEMEKESTETPAVSLRNVDLHYGSNQALKDVSLDVRKHEVVALIGPSGSGKSTLLRTINLLADISAGEVVVDGKTVARIRSDGADVRLDQGELNKHRTDIGMVFQHFNLFPNMTAIQNVMAGPTTVLKKPRQEAEAEAKELLRAVGLAGMEDRAPHQLSGGQKQRVATARALAMNPKVMLFDEATSALDPEVVGEVIAIMRRLAGQGMTMLCATHEMDFAADVADTVVFMAEGQIIESGPARQVLENPRHERTQRFLERVINRSSGSAIEDEG